MILISIHIDEDVREAYRQIAELPAAKEYLSTIRPNAGYGELMRKVIRESLPNLQAQFSSQ